MTAQILPFAAAILVATATQALPRYDIVGDCDLRSRGWHAEGPDNPAGRNVCVAQEQRAYDVLKILWPQLDAQAQSRCLRISDAPPHSYERLRACARLIAPASDSRREPKFHY